MARIFADIQDVKPASARLRYPEMRLMPMVQTILFAPVPAAGQTAVLRKEISMPHAHGSFTVDVHPLTPTPAAGLSRFTINKVIHGDLEATTIGEMLAGGDPRSGAAGYVAIEVVTGTMDGKHGTFALQHFATMDENGPRMQVIVVPGSGSGDFKGIEGTFFIHIEEGKHSYHLEYTLP